MKIASLVDKLKLYPTQSSDKVAVIISFADEGKDGYEGDYTAGGALKDRNIRATTGKKYRGSCCKVMCSLTGTVTSITCAGVRGISASSIQSHDIWILFASVCEAELCAGR
ncbi:MAG TPA: hypothetical protein VHB48_09135 [Chitinophagaceae bacterium]|nr:hypothetical protein [Chitinophagaceae bacterium]